MEREKRKEDISSEDTVIWAELPQDLGETISSRKTDVITATRLAEEKKKAQQEAD